LNPQEKSALSGASGLSLSFTLRGHNCSDGRLFYALSNKLSLNGLPGHQPNAVFPLALHVKQLRAGSAEPVVLQVMAVFLSRPIIKLILHVENKYPPLTQVMQGLGTLRVCAVAHHLNSPLRLQRFARSGAGMHFV